jgi:hypothetical protein
VYQSSISDWNWVGKDSKFYWSVMGDSSSLYTGQLDKLEESLMYQHKVIHKKLRVLDVCSYMHYAKLYSRIALAQSWERLFVLFAVISHDGSCRISNTSSGRRRMVVILVVGKYSNQPLTEGRKEFRTCPVSECWLTRDKIKFQRTADVLLLMIANSSVISSYLPKPSHQVP